MWSILRLGLVAKFCFGEYSGTAKGFRAVGGDFLGLCDQKSSYKHVSDFGQLRSYDRLNLRIEGNYY